MAWYDTPIRPYDPVIEYDRDTGSIRYYRDNFSGNGQNSFVQAPAQPQDIFEALVNCMPIMRGTLDKRRGYTYINTLPAAAQHSFEYQSDSLFVRRLLWSQQDDGSAGVNITATNEDGSTFISNLFALGAYSSMLYTPPHCVCSRDYEYINIPVARGNTSNPNVCLKWNGHSFTDISNWGMAAPPDAAGITSTSSSGAITLIYGRNYFITYNNSFTGHYSDLSPVSASTGPLTAKEVVLDLSGDSTPADSQVTDLIILATADGGDETLLYFVASVPKGTTTYTDNTDEPTLLANPVYQETDSFGNNFGVADNTPPPQLTGSLTVTYPLVHNGRLFLAGNQSIFFSKALADLTTSTGVIAGKWEESWPASYVMTVSSEAEFITGLLSDGVSLYIGTNQHIRRVTGDGPTGTNPFVLPQVIFNNVGVVNQEVWQKVYQQGQPVGCMWLTPNLRVIGSDFSTYRDLGTPVQDILNTINTAVFTDATPGVCFAGYFGDESYDIYLLAVPTGDSTVANTVLMYDLRNNQWHTWSLANGVEVPTTFLYNLAQNGTTNWYFNTSDHSLYRFDETTQFDRNLTANPIPVAATVVSAWMHMGMPVDRKWLNEIEVLSADPNLKVTVDGASTTDDFNFPFLLKGNSPLILSPFGTYKVFLAVTEAPAKFRYYRFTFFSETVDLLNTSFLGGYNIEAIPIHKL